MVTERKDRVDSFWQQLESDVKPDGSRTVDVLGSKRHRMTYPERRISSG